LYLFHLLCKDWMTDAYLHFQLTANWLATIHELQYQKYVTIIYKRNKEALLQF
jgi:hypothetical protein